jgi:hypothetical protein
MLEKTVLLLTTEIEQLQAEAAKLIQPLREKIEQAFTEVQKAQKEIRVLRKMVFPSVKALLEYTLPETVIIQDGNSYFADTVDPNNLLLRHDPNSFNEFEATLSGFYVCPNCGVVVGRPNDHSYNDIGHLAGSRGTRYHCHLCNVEIADHVFEMS